MFTKVHGSFVPLEANAKGIRDFNATEFAALFNVLSEVRNRCPLNQSELNAATIDNRTMNEHFARNGGKGCVFFFSDKEAAGTSAYDISRGIFPPSALNRKDFWAEKASVDQMVDKEVGEWENDKLRSSPGDKKDTFYIAQWLVTPGPNTPTITVGIEGLTVNYVYDSLFWAGAGNMSPQKFPTVLMVDYLGVVIPQRHDFAKDADH